MGDDRQFHGRVLLIAGLVAGGLLLWTIQGVVLLAVAAMLFAVIIDGLASQMIVRFGVRRTPALIVTIGILALLAGSALWLAGDRIVQQMAELTEAVTGYGDNLAELLQGLPFGEKAIRELRELEAGRLLGSGVFYQVTGIASAAFGILMDLVLIIAAALYLAASPRRYTAAAIQLVPPRHRERARTILRETGASLRRYLVGKAISMTITAGLTTAGLLILGMPFPFVLGALAGILEFVPLFGPIFASIPAAILGLADSSQKAMLVLGLYFAVQQVESYLLLPKIQQRAVHLPPVVTIFSVVAMGVVFGVPGVFLSEPLTVILIVWTRMLYVEDTLERRNPAPVGARPEDLTS